MNSIARSVAPLSIDHRWPWVRDFGLVGGLTGFVAPYSVLRDLHYASLTGLGGALSGALLGLFSAWFMSGKGRRWSRAAFVPAGLALGAIWGGTSVLPTAITSNMRDLLPLSMFVAGVAGALQLGWFWLAYCERRATRRPTVHLVVLASLLSGGLGWAGVAALTGLH